MKTGFRFFLFLAGFALSSCSHKSERAPASYATSEAVSPKLDVSSIPVEVPPSTESFVFDWPVDRARMTRGFLPNKRRPHLGIDLAAPRGTSILSAQKGVVIYAGRDFRGFGKMILVESGTGWATIYAHLDKILVSEGQRVIQGEVIGTMGKTGRATGVHLHFEIRRDKGPVDPLLFLPQRHKVANFRPEQKAL